MFEVEENGSCANCFHVGKCLKISTGPLQSTFILLCQHCLQQGVAMLNREPELSTPGNFMIIADQPRCPMCGDSNVLPTIINKTSSMVCQTCGYTWE